MIDMILLAVFEGPDDGGGGFVAGQDKAQDADYGKDEARGHKGEAVGNDAVVAGREGVKMGSDENDRDDGQGR
jgi:hypothetical protein